MLKLSVRMQWHNRWRHSAPPHIFHQEILWSTKKKGTRKGNGEEKKENLKGKKWKIENRRGKVWKWAEDLLFYLFIYLFIYFACHFLKPLKFVWGLPEWTILPGKIIFHAGTKSGNLTLLPLKNITPTPLHRFSDSNIDDYNDVWYSTPLSFNLKTTVFVKIWKTLHSPISLLDKCIVFHIRIRVMLLLD